MSTAMEKTVEQVMEDTEKMYDERDMLAECMQCIACDIDTDSEVTMHVYQADVEKGVLAIGLTEIFRHPNGEMGKAQWNRSVIYEQAQRQETVYCEVAFYISKEDMINGQGCYKMYKLQQGERILMPVSPQISGAIFSGWKDVNDYFADFSQPVEQDLTYYASWN